VPRARVRPRVNYEQLLYDPTWQGLAGPAAARRKYETARLADELRRGTYRGAVGTLDPDTGGGGGVLGFTGRLFGQIAKSLALMPYGTFLAGGAAGLAARRGLSDITGGVIPADGASYRPAREMAVGMYHQYGEDIHHPIERPGYLAMDIATTVPAIYGAGARLGLLARGLRGAAEAIPKAKVPGISVEDFAEVPKPPKIKLPGYGKQLGQVEPGEQIPLHELISKLGGQPLKEDYANFLADMPKEHHKALLKVKLPEAETVTNEQGYPVRRYTASSGDRIEMQFPKTGEGGRGRVKVIHYPPAEGESVMPPIKGKSRTLGEYAPVREQHGYPAAKFVAETSARDLELAAQGNKIARKGFSFDQSQEFAKRLLEQADEEIKPAQVRPAEAEPANPLEAEMYKGHPKVHLDQIRDLLYTTKGKERARKISDRGIQQKMGYGTLEEAQSAIQAMVERQADYELGTKTRIAKQGAPLTEEQRAAAEALTAQGRPKGGKMPTQAERVKAERAMKAPGKKPITNVSKISREAMTDALKLYAAQVAEGRIPGGERMNKLLEKHHPEGVDVAHADVLSALEKLHAKMQTAKAAQAAKVMPTKRTVGGVEVELRPGKPGEGEHVFIGKKKLGTLKAATRAERDKQIGALVAKHKEQAEKGLVAPAREAKPAGRAPIPIEAGEEVPAALARKMREIAKRDPGTHIDPKTGRIKHMGKLATQARAELQQAAEAAGKKPPKYTMKSVSATKLREAVEGKKTEVKEEIYEETTGEHAGKLRVRKTVTKKLAEGELPQTAMPHPLQKTHPLVVEAATKLIRGNRNISDKALVGRVTGIATRIAKRRGLTPKGNQGALKPGEARVVPPPSMRGLGEEIGKERGVVGRKQLGIAAKAKQLRDAAATYEARESGEMRPVEDAQALSETASHPGEAGQAALRELVSRRHYERAQGRHENAELYDRAIQDAKNALKGEPPGPAPPKTRVTPRETGESLRAKEEAPRQKGQSPRQRRTNPNALKLAGAPGDKANELSANLDRLYNDAAGAGLKAPPIKDVAAEFTDVLGPTLGKKVFQQWAKAAGGAGTFAQRLATGLKWAIRPPSPGERFHKLETFNIPLEGGGELQVSYPVTTLKSRSPLVRHLGDVKYRILEDPEGSFVPEFAQTWFKNKMEKHIKAKKQEALKLVEKEVGIHLLEKKAMEAWVKGGKQGDLGTFTANHVKTELDNIVKEARKKWQDSGKKGKPYDWIDTSNQVAVLGALLLKPAYIPANMLGNLEILMVDHAWNPYSLARSVMLQRAVLKKYPELRQRLHQSVRGGIMESLAFEKGLKGPVGRFINAAYRSLASEGVPGPAGYGFKRVDGKVTFGKGGKIYPAAEWLLDNRWRDAALFNEFRRQGYKTADQVYKLMTDDGLGGERLEMYKRASRNAVEYGKLNNAERDWVRRVVFFYPWIKASTFWTMRTFTEHPVQTAIRIGAARQGEEKIKKALGPLPSYMQGVFPVGKVWDKFLGKQMPLVMNPQAIGAAGSAGQVAGMLGEMAQARQTGAARLSQFLNPTFSAGVAEITGIDPFTSEAATKRFPGWPKGLPFGVYAEQFARSVAPYQLFEDVNRLQGLRRGEGDIEQTMLPMSPSERVGRYLGPGLGALTGLVPGWQPHPLGEYRVNLKEAHSRAFAEKVSTQNAFKREVYKHREYFKDWNEKAREVGMLRGNQTLPSSVRQAMELRGRRQGELASFKHKVGHNLSPREILTADMALMVNLGHLTPEQAAQTTKSSENWPDKTIQYVDRIYRDAYLGGKVLSAYRRAINQYAEARGKEPLRTP
jgi:hypothetical protein